MEAVAQQADRDDTQQPFAIGLLPESAERAGDAALVAGIVTPGSIDQISAHEAEKRAARHEPIDTQRANRNRVLLSSTRLFLSRVTAR